MILSSHRRLNTKPDKASLELSWQQLKSVLKTDKPYIIKLIKEGVMPGRMHVNSPQKVSPSRRDDLVQFYKVVKTYSLPLGAANDDMIAWGDDNALQITR